MKATCYTETRLQETLGNLRQAWKENRYLRVQWSTEKPRSLPQNAILHAWIEQIARELGEDTPEGVKCEIKLRFAVPILRAEDEAYREAYDAALKPLSYEQKLKAMRYWPATSLMNVSQLSRLLEDVQRAYGSRVALQFPADYERAA